MKNFFVSFVKSLIGASLKPNFSSDFWRLLNELFIIASLIFLLAIFILSIISRNFDILTNVFSGLLTKSSYLINKKFIPIISLVSPYRDLREEFKSKYNVLEVYLHTTEIRGRESYFVEDYEPPIVNFIDMDTTAITKEESVNEILNVYR